MDRTLATSALLMMSVIAAYCKTESQLGLPQDKGLLSSVTIAGLLRLWAWGRFTTPPASRQEAYIRSFDRLVGAGEQRWRD